MVKDELLNNEDYIKILQERFKTKDIEFVDAEIKNFSKNVEGLLGEHYSLIIKYNLKGEEKSQCFFIKTKPSTEGKQRKVADIVFLKEVYLYQTLFNEYEKYGYYTGFAPKCYYIKDGDTFVMDHLIDNGLKLYKRNHFFDIDHCKAALNALAHFHANSFAYEEMKSKETGSKYRLCEAYPLEFIPTLFKENDDLGKQFITSGLQCFIQMSKLLDKPEEWKNNFEKTLKEIDCSKIFNKPLPYRTCSTHGDLWSNNMLFKYENGIPVQCVLIDYQVLRHHHLAYDVLLLLSSNTSREFRKNNKKAILKYYYSTLGYHLKQHGLEANDILSKEDFLASIRHFEPVAIVQGAVTRTILMVPKDIINSNTEKDHFDTMLFKAERGKFLLAGFENDQHFRSIMIDDMCDLEEHWNIKFISTL